MPEKNERLLPTFAPSAESIRKQKQIRSACELIQAAVSEAVEGLPVGTAIKLREKIRGFTVTVQVTIDAEE